MKCNITYFDTSFVEKELQVFFYVKDEWYPVMDIPFKVLSKAVPGLLPRELEVLIGSTLETGEFYRVGEQMGEGKLAKANNLYPKPSIIRYAPGLDLLRKDRSQQLLTFKQIYSVDVSTKNSPQPYARLKTTDNLVYFDKLDYFKSKVGLDPSDFRLLRGVFISPLMFKKGEISDQTGSFIAIREDNKIVKTFNFRIDGNLDEHFALLGRVALEAIKADSTKRFSWRPSEGGVGCYEKYGGYNGWDDFTIDSAFEGDPEATWNVD